jgi:hypothetical protein
MKYKIPKTFMGKPVAGSLERVLAGLNGNTNNPQTQPPQTTPSVNAPNISGYVFVPSTGLYMAKQRTHGGLDWYKTHEALQSEGLKMPTIYEFRQFLKYLKENPNGVNGVSSTEVESILDDILTVRDPWRAEWLNAKFEETNGEMNVHYLINSNGSLVDKTEVLEDCLMKDKTPGINLDYWINTPGKQNLPLKKNPKGKLYYWFPRDGRVAWFVASSDWALLYCDWNPTDVYSSLGVFACAEGAPPKI